MNSYFTGTPLQIGNENQLLIDDTIIEDRWRLRRVMHPPDKSPRNPILVTDKPWEGDMIHGTNVIWDEEYGRYRMWYMSFFNSTYFYGNGPVEIVYHAESEDGFNWVKTMRDQVPFGRHKKTNIVHTGIHDQGTYYGNTDPSATTTRVQVAGKTQVFKDMKDPDPARRYKMISLEGRPHPTLKEIHTGVSLLVSPDGFHWKLAGNSHLLDHSSDCLNHLVRDERNDRWLMVCRPPVWHSGRNDSQRNIRRRIAMMTSKDLVNWTYPRVVMYPDEYDTPDYDHNLVFPYGNIFIMFYGAFAGDTTGHWEMRLATSRDGFHWERYHTRETYMARGPKGSWDGGGVLPSTPPIQVGERLLLYYNGTKIGQEEQGDFIGSIGMATIRLDRFVEQRADQTPGYLLTKEFILQGKTLRVNMEINKSTNLPERPRLRAEILRHPPFGQHWDFKEAYEGFSFDDCDPMCIDHTDSTITWKGNKDISSLAGKPVYIRFELVYSGIYSFRIAKE